MSLSLGIEQRPWRAVPASGCQSLDLIPKGIPHVQIRARALEASRTGMIPAAHDRMSRYTMWTSKSCLLSFYLNEPDIGVPITSETLVKIAATASCPRGRVLSWSIAVVYLSVAWCDVSAITCMSKYANATRRWLTCRRL